MYSRPFLCTLGCKINLSCEPISVEVNTVKYDRFSAQADTKVETFIPVLLNGWVFFSDTEGEWPFGLTNRDLIRSPDWLLGGRYGSGHGAIDF